MFGFMVIIALDVVLKKADSTVSNWWFYVTLMFYNGYCCLEYRLTDNEQEKIEADKYDSRKN